MLVITIPISEICLLLSNEVYMYCKRRDITDGKTIDNAILTIMVNGMIDDRLNAIASWTERSGISWLNDIDDEHHWIPSLMYRSDEHIPKTKQAISQSLCGVTNPDDVWVNDYVTDDVRVIKNLGSCTRLPEHKPVIIGGMGVTDDLFEVGLSQEDVISNQVRFKDNGPKGIWGSLTYDEQRSISRDSIYDRYGNMKPEYSNIIRKMNRGRTYSRSNDRGEWVWVKEDGVDVYRKS